MDRVAIESAHQRNRITKMLLAIFARWNLSVKQQLCLLGESETNRSLLRRYRRGESSLRNRDKLERAGILLGIYKSLRILFPHNHDLANNWMTTPNRAFKERSPERLIEEQGMMGLYIVRAYLERQLNR